MEKCMFRCLLENKNQTLFFFLLYDIIRWKYNLKGAILGKSAGFCAGVKYAVESAEKAVQEFDKLYCLGELVHNQEVIKELENRGLKIVEDLSEVDGTTIIRAHGAEKEIYEMAKRKNIQLLDCTCKKVLLIHDLVKEYANNGYYIIVVGKTKHPEVVSTISFCGESKGIIEKIEDVEKVINDVEKQNKDKVLVVAQTTINEAKFEEIAEKIREEIKQKIGTKIELEIRNTICNATSIRQKETKDLSNNVDLMIIIGGKNSSNTNRLYEIANKYCKNAIMVATYKEIDRSYTNQFDKIGIMAGASTPKKSIQEVIDYLQDS